MESLNFSTISTINSELPQNNYVDESVASTIANISCMDVAATKTTGNDKSYKYEKKRKKKKNETEREKGKETRNEKKKKKTK